MAWYDVFAPFYDASVEMHYRSQRALAAEALQLGPTSAVLDVPCGTGQSLPHLAAPGRRIVGADLSEGMLRQARNRVERAGWDATIVHADALTLDRAALDAAVGAPFVPDRLHVFLGMSVFPDLEATFANLWSLLAPGGRCVLVDVHAERLGPNGRLVNWIAGADITRRFWEPLERVGEGFERRALPSSIVHGGTLWLATATKPG